MTKDKDATDLSFRTDSYLWNENQFVMMFCESALESEQYTIDVGDGQLAMKEEQAYVEGFIQSNKQWMQFMNATRPMVLIQRGFCCIIKSPHAMGVFSRFWRHILFEFCIRCISLDGHTACIID